MVLHKTSRGTHLPLTPVEALCTQNNNLTGAVMVFKNKFFFFFKDVVWHLICCRSVCLSYDRTWFYFHNLLHVKYIKNKTHKKSIEYVYYIHLLFGILRHYENSPVWRTGVRPYPHKRRQLGWELDPVWQVMDSPATFHVKQLRVIPSMALHLPSETPTWAPGANHESCSWSSKQTSRSRTEVMP